MATTIAIATHSDTGENRDVTQAPATCVLPHVGELIRAPRPDCVVSLRERDLQSSSPPQRTNIYRGSYTRRLRNVMQANYPKTGRRWQRRNATATRCMQPYIHESYHVRH